MHKLVPAALRLWQIPATLLLSGGFAAGDTLVVHPRYGVTPKVIGGIAYHVDEPGMTSTTRS